MRYLLIAIYIICTTGGIAFMKMGGDSLKLGLNNGLSFSMGWKTFIGFLLYLVSFLLWQKLIVKYDLTMMVPIVTGIVQIIIILIGCLLFKENVSVVNLIGIALVIIGVVLISIKG